MKLLRQALEAFGGFMNRSDISVKDKLLSRCVTDDFLQPPQVGRAPSRSARLAPSVSEPTGVEPERGGVAIAAGIHHLFGGARRGGNRREAGHDGVLFLGAFLPLTQPHRWWYGRWLHQRYALASGLHPQHCPIGWPPGRLDRLHLKGRDIPRGVGHTGFDGLQAE